MNLELHPSFAGKPSRAAFVGTLLGSGKCLVRNSDREGMHDVVLSTAP